MEKPILEDCDNIFEGIHCSRFIEYINRLEAYCEYLESENKRMSNLIKKFIYDESHGEKEGGF